MPWVPKWSAVPTNCILSPISCLLGWGGLTLASQGGWTPSFPPRTSHAVMAGKALWVHLNPTPCPRQGLEFMKLYPCGRSFLSPAWSRRWMILSMSGENCLFWGAQGVFVTLGSPSPLFYPRAKTDPSEKVRVPLCCCLSRSKLSQLGPGGWDQTEISKDFGNSNSK